MAWCLVSVAPSLLSFEAFWSFLSDSNLIDERRCERIKINAVIANSAATCFDSLVGIKR